MVLNVGQAHVGEFGGQAAIAQAKGELVEALPADGVAVLNADDPLVWAMRTADLGVGAGLLGVAPTAGRPGGLGRSDLVSDQQGRYAFRLRRRDSEARLEVQLRVAGRHQVANALAAAAAALALGLPLADDRRRAERRGARIAVADGAARSGRRGDW